MENIILQEVRTNIYGKQQFDTIGRFTSFKMADKAFRKLTTKNRVEMWDVNKPEMLAVKVEVSND